MQEIEPMISRKRAVARGKEDYKQLGCSKATESEVVRHLGTRKMASSWRRFLPLSARNSPEWASGNAQVARVWPLIP